MCNRYGVTAGTVIVALVSVVLTDASVNVCIVSTSTFAVVA